MPGSATSRYDAIVIGSGFGGSLAAHALVHAGLRVLMLERGDWVPRSPANWGDEGSLELTSFYSKESPIHVPVGGYGDIAGACHCVGGPSVFYGSVAFRFREADFQPPADIVADSGARWPLAYEDLEPWYTQVEQLLGISGDDAEDPTRPHRSAPFPQPPPPLARISQRLADSARDLGLHPFPLPLAIDFHGARNATACQTCRTCDTFACAIGAKNDLATTVLPALQRQGLELLPNTAATHIEVEHGKARAVEAVDRNSHEKRRFEAEVVIVAAGTLATPHLLLAADLARHNAAGQAVGRYLMRHCNAMVFGVFPDIADPDHTFHKQLAIHDYYFGDTDDARAPGKLGCIQQVMTPPASLVRARLPWGLRSLLSPLVENLTGLLAIAEDQPRPDNGVTIEREHRDALGLPRLVVEHRYTERDERARKVLVQRAKQILRHTGAIAFHTHHIKTFSHAVGTVRMGEDPATSPLDAHGRFRGVDNLFVTDGSALPTSAGVNPSLTIAANALRIGSYIARGAQA